MRWREDNMKSHHGGRAVPSGLAALTLMLVAGCASASSNGYKFALASRSNAAVAVQLIDRRTGGLVTNTELFAVRWIPTGLKTVPLREQRTPLAADGHGGFLAKATGGTLHLAAKVPGQDELVYGEIELNH
jgi:hypothetical protein